MFLEMKFDSNALGSYKKMEDPVSVPTEMSARTQVTIERVTNPTVLGYTNNMNAKCLEVKTLALLSQVEGFQQA